MPDVKRSGKELTGRHVLLMVLGFFGVIILVNGSFLFAAISSFSGEDVKGSYRQGLEYNRTLKARNVQNELGWDVAANFVATTEDTGRIIVRFRGAGGEPVNGLDVTGKLRHPTDLAQDRSLTFIAEGGGLYGVSTEILTGKWELRAAAQKGEDIFRFKYDLQP